MKETKTIILDDEYVPNLINEEETLNETQKIVQNIYDRFMNETNFNNCQVCKNSLNDYRYIRNNWIVPSGRYLRYLDTSNSKNIVLKKGGFVVDCNKYIFTLYDKKYGQFKIDKRNRLFFMKLTDDDINRCKLQAYM